MTVFSLRSLFSLEAAAFTVVKPRVSRVVVDFGRSSGFVLPVPVFVSYIARSGLM